MRWTDLCFSRIYAIAFKRSPLRTASPARQLRAQARTSRAAAVALKSCLRVLHGFLWPVIARVLLAGDLVWSSCFCRMYDFMFLPDLCVSGKDISIGKRSMSSPPTVNPFWKAKILIITTGRPGKPAHLTMILPDHCVCHSDYLFMNDWSPCGSEVGVGWGPDTTVHGSGQVCSL